MLPASINLSRFMQIYYIVTILQPERGIKGQRNCAADRGVSTETGAGRRAGRQFLYGTML